MSDQKPNDDGVNEDDENDELTDEEQQRLDEAVREEEGRKGLDFIVSVADERIKAYFTQNWPVMIHEVAGAVAEKINIEDIAVKAAKVFENRWNEQARANQAAAGGGGSDANPPTVDGSGNGGDGRDDLGFLNDIPEPDGSNSATQSRSGTNQAKQAVASLGMEIVSDPFGSLDKAVNTIANAISKFKPPPTAPRHDLDILEDIAGRKPWMIDIFASQDPMAPAEKLAEALHAGLKSGMGLAETMQKYNIRTGLGKKSPKFEVPKVEVGTPEPVVVTTPAAAPAEPIVTPPTVAVMAQEPNPNRRRRKLSDVVQ